MKNIIIFLIIFSSAVIAGGFFVVDTTNIQIGIFQTIIRQDTEEETIVPTLPTTISLVGDIMLGRQVETFLKKYGVDYVYATMPPVSSSTILVGNFEAPIPITHVQTPEMTFSFSVDAQYIPALSEYGFQYVSVANNHTFDTGQTDFKNTRQVLEKNGIKTFGEPQQFSTTSIQYLTVQGGIVALVGLHTLQKLPSDTEIADLIKEASNNSDLQIAYMHWGNEYQLVHSRAQQVLARKLIDTGFDAVIGSHPHVVQDIELYKNKLIFYSLGNFIFDQYFSKDVQEGLWLDIGIIDDTFVYKIKGITSIGSHAVPRFMQAVENQISLDGLAKRSSPKLSTMIKLGNIEL